MSATTIREVAKEAGVSTASVSRILRGGVGYSYPAATEMRVRAAAERLGYQANAAARLLRTQKTKTIGVATEVTVRPHINHMVVAVHKELKRRGYEPILFEPMQLVPSRSHAPFPSLELLAGMVCVDFSLEEHFPALCEGIYEQVPVVTLYPTRSVNAVSVFTDLEKGAEIAVEHLQRLGHQRIALSSTTGGWHPSSALKRLGWQRTVKKYNLHSDPDYIITLAHTDTLVEMGDKIAKAILRMSPAPTALLCHSDEVALYAVRYLTAEEWQTPQDISIVGFDGIEWGAYANPPLTTVTQPFERIAGYAVESLAEHIDWRAKNKASGQCTVRLDAPAKRLLEPTLLIRGSTAPAGILK